MYFALVAYDRPNSVARRLAHRPAHIEFLQSLGETLILAGPFVAENGDMVGSIVVIDVESETIARETFGRDPFMANQLFDSVTIKPWKLSINNTK